MYIAGFNLTMALRWASWLSHGEWVMASLTFIYVLFTGCYVCISHNTLAAIKAQGKSNADQFREQLDVLKLSGQKTDELIKQATAQAGALIKVAAATEQNAKAAMASADALRASVETTMNKERARVRFDLGNVIAQNKSVGPNAISCLISNYGSSIAFISDSKARYYVSAVPDDAIEDNQCAQLMYAESLQPNTNSFQFLTYLQPDAYLDADQVASIRSRTMFLYFYGFIKHQDIFERNWRTTVHMCWRIRLGGIIEGSVTDYWEPVGRPEDNTEVEELRSSESPPRSV
jgi:ribosomal protein L12E/L44/L45/RPP1/RPP2